MAGGSVMSHEHSGRQAPSHGAECPLAPIDARRGCSAECRPPQRCRLWPNRIHSVRTFDRWQRVRSGISGTRPVFAAHSRRCRRPAPRCPPRRLDDRGDDAASSSSARPGRWAPQSPGHGAMLMDVADFCPPGAWPGGWRGCIRARGGAANQPFPGRCGRFT